MSNSANLLCPLCCVDKTKFFYQDSKRSYYECSMCELIFVTPEYYLSAEDEKAVYDMHQNSPADVEYRRFLDRLFTPLLSRLKQDDKGLGIAAGSGIRAGAKGLDFGSGPGPTLSIMFEEAGYPMDLYDYFYAPDLSVFDRSYDFITATEVLEHLHCPGETLAKLWQCLKPGGFLGVMTKLVQEKQRFYDWHYKNDPTHVCFYSEKSMQELAKNWQAGLDVLSSDVVIFTKEAEFCDATV